MGKSWLNPRPSSHRMQKQMLLASCVNTHLQQCVSHYLHGAFCTVFCVLCIFWGLKPECISLKYCLAGGRTVKQKPPGKCPGHEKSPEIVGGYELNGRMGQRKLARGMPFSYSHSDHLSNYFGQHKKKKNVLSLQRVETRQCAEAQPG